jgi:hypothetical protein
MNFGQLSEQVHAYVEQNEILLSINLLSDHMRDETKKDEVCQLAARYRMLEKNHISGIIKYDDYDRHYRLICKHVLELLRLAEDDYFPRASPASPPPKPADGKATKEQIPVFFSVGSPHVKSQTDYIEKLKVYLLKEYEIELQSMEQYSVSIRDPLKPIQNRMSECCGCLVLAMERLHVKEAIAKRGSEKEDPIINQNYSTPWSHIEAAMAYQSGLPFLILKEQDIKSEGMLDDHLFVGKIVRIDTTKPDAIGEYPINSLIKTWVEDVWKTWEANRKANNPRMVSVR